jgi:hypothetical protein
MKKKLSAAALCLVSSLCFSCASSDVSSRMNYYHGQTIPDQFFKVLRWSPDAVELEIKVDFKAVHMYHIILDENDRPLSEAWLPTAMIGSAYTVVMKPKEGLFFEAGKKYRLCIGTDNPEEVFVTSSNYPCVADYEFVLTMK